MADLSALLSRCAEGEGRIVSSGDLTPLQISEAQANDRFYVDDFGLGYALLPWGLTTDKDRIREGTFAGSKAS